jgi:hypothetical protein
MPARAPSRIPSIPKLIPEPPKQPSNRTIPILKNEVVVPETKPITITYAEIVKQPKPIKKEEWRPTTPPYAPEDFLKKEDDVWHE